jgi:hypothetical protein
MCLEWFAAVMQQSGPTDLNGDTLVYLEIYDGTL